MRVRLAHRTHHVTDDGAVMVCDTRQALVHTVHGPYADALRALLAAAESGADTDRDGWLDVTDPIAADLVAAGVVEAAEAAATAPLDRRRALALSAGALAGIVTLALPTAAHAASVALPAAPTSTPTFSRSTSTRNIRVTWTSTPEVFNYDWIVYASDAGLVEKARGTASSGSLPTVIYTMPIGVTLFRVEVTSITSTATSYAANLSF
ncbi:MAG: hypothetical protein ACO3C1_11190 [Ilumatobacteraceae bacterium]